LNNLIREASIGLNLAPHYVVNGRKAKGEIEIASCVDLEGHRGGDTRLYLLDFSRTFPPAMKDLDKKEAYDNMWPYYHMLRSELVSRWEKPLCADAFSNFQSGKTREREEEKRKQNQEVCVATSWLETEGVIRVCRALLDESDSTRSLARTMHGCGMNMRYLGLVYAQLVSSVMFDKTRSNLYNFILIEGVVRVVKARLRSQLRSVKSDCESQIMTECAHVLNVFFGHYDSVTKFLEANPFLVPGLIQSFNFDQRSAKACVDLIYQNRVVRSINGELEQEKLSARFIVLSELNEVVGLGINKKVLMELSASSSSSTGAKGIVHRRSFGQKVIFSDSDFNFMCRVKNLDIVERAAALRMYLEATDEGFSSPDPLLRAFGILDSALDSNPNDSYFAALMGDVCKALYDLYMHDDETRAVLFKERAETCYKGVALREPLSFKAQMRYGLFLAQTDSNLKEAETRLLTAMELVEKDKLAFDQDLVLNLIMVLEKLGKSQKASLIRDGFLLRYRNNTMDREPSVIMTDADKSASGVRERLEKQKSKIGKKFLIPRNKPSAEELSPSSSVLEGWILRKSEKSNSKQKRRWIKLGKNGVLKHYDGAPPLGRALGSVMVGGATISLNDPYLEIKLPQSKGKISFSPSDDADQPSIEKWYEVLMRLSKETQQSPSGFKSVSKAATRDRNNNKLTTSDTLQHLIKSAGSKK
jgi:hypothetical protein